MEHEDEVRREEELGLGDWNLDVQERGGKVKINQPERNEEAQRKSCEKKGGKKKKKESWWYKDGTVGWNDQWSGKEMDTRTERDTTNLFATI